MPKRKKLLLAALVMSCALPIAAQASGTPHWVHYKLLNKSANLPKKVVVIPASVNVYEVTAGGVTEEVPEWSEEAGKNIFASLSGAILQDPSMEEVALPRLSNEESAIMDEHMALYKLVVNTASDIDLEHKYARFDYSIGPGLAMLQRKSGADAALMVYGRDYASTAGRKAKAVLGNIPIINIFTGPAPQLGHSFIHVGMVDLRTGDLLWMNSEFRDGGSNLRALNDAKDIIGSIFKWYPGIEKYRKSYVK